MNYRNSDENIEQRDPEIGEMETNFNSENGNELHRRSFSNPTNYVNIEQSQSVADNFVLPDRGPDGRIQWNNH